MLARLLLWDQKHYVITGLFVMGCVPGGDASNFWTYLLGANVNLSVSMTFISTVASLG
jgi:sodium/bile acid cotransporter 3/5